MNVIKLRRIDRMYHSGFPWYRWGIWYYKQDKNGEGYQSEEERGYAFTFLGARLAIMRMEKKILRHPKTKEVWRSEQ